MRKMLFAAVLIANAAAAQASDWWSPIVAPFRGVEPLLNGAFGTGLNPPPPPIEAVPGPSLWRGHFSGGRNAAPGAVNIALDWTDQVAFFPTDGECRRWIADLRRAYRTYEGFKGCLRIR